MKAIERRSFLKASFSSIAAGGLLTELGRKPLLAQARTTGGQPEPSG